jgi:hypothetical protein
LKLVDVFLIDETKLDDTVPTSLFLNNNYIMLRLDRNEKSKKKNDESKKGGEGLMAFIRRGYKLVKYEYLLDFETIYFQLQVKNQFINFLHS